MAARIDDLGIGQDQVDKARVHPVIRHFVDEQRPRGAALHPGPREIIHAQHAQFICRHMRQRGGIIIDRARDQRDIGKLSRALHRAMAGKDLLDQRGACARHAQHKNRIGRSATAAR